MRVQVVTSQLAQSLATSKKRHGPLFAWLRARKQSFKESGRRWAERKMRASGRMSAVPENSAKVKGQRRRPGVKASIC